MGAVKDKIYKSIPCLNRIIKEEAIKIVSSHKDEIIELILKTFDDRLSNVHVDSNSKTKPGEYTALFKKELEDQLIIKVSDSGVSINTPDMKSFIFKGKLKVLQQVFEGIAGEYVEVSFEDYEKMFGSLEAGPNTFEDFETTEGLFFLMKYDDLIKIKENHVLNKKLVKYPFSNIPPMDDIFLSAKKFVDTNFGIWLKEATIKATKRYVKECF